jgi:hypothetical protein
MSFYPEKSGRTPTLAYQLEKFAMNADVEFVTLLGKSRTRALHSKLKMSAFAVAIGG